MLVSAKDLGVFLDPHLTYYHHISCVVSSCFAKLCQINRVKRSFDRETLELLITSLVFSKMLYCSSVWSNTTLQNINRLQSIQNFASKIVTNSRKFDHVTPLLRELNWLPVKEQIYSTETPFWPLNVRMMLLLKLLFIYLSKPRGCCSFRISWQIP